MQMKGLPIFEVDGAWGVSSGRPLDDEFADYAKPDIDAVPGDDAVGALAAQARDTLALLASLDDDEIRGRTYAQGKWTVKQVIGHVCDDERIRVSRPVPRAA